MKRNDLLKAIGISFLVLVVMTWFITAGTYAKGVFVNGQIEALGIFSILGNGPTTIANYATHGLYILAIGGLYGVLKATGSYDNLIAGVAKKFNNNRKKFIITSVILFGLLSSFTSLQLILLILVPVFAAILLELGYSKISAFMATFGAILVGNIGALYGFSISGYINYYFKLDINNNIWLKIVFLVLLLALLIMYIMKYEVSHDAKVKVINNKKHGEKTLTKKVKAATKEKIIAKVQSNCTGMVVLVILLVLILLVGNYNWSYAIGFKGFEELYSSIVLNSFGKNILGKVDPIGFWSISEGISLILVFSFIIGWVYRLKFKEIVDSFVKGARTLVAPAILVALANIVLFSVLGSKTGNNVFFTIENQLLTMANNTFNPFIGYLTGLVGGLFINDFTYFIGYSSTPLKTVFTDPKTYSALGLILQSAHGLTMLVVPTSLLVVLGLSYLDISIKDYYKYVWKFLLQVLVLSIIVIAIAVMFI